MGKSFIGPGAKDAPIIFNKFQSKSEKIENFPSKNS